MNNLLPTLDQSFSRFFTKDFVDATILTRGENLIVQNAVQKRQSEFSTGRYCAKQALSNLGINHVEILKGSRGEPLWPESVTGSISHNNALCGAIVADKANVTAIGMDIETIGSVKTELWHVLFTNNEVRFLNSLPLSEKELFATIFFSLKESFYKLQYPLTHLFLEFTEVEMSYHDGHFSLTPVDPDKLAALPQLPLHLLYDTYQGNVITVCYL